MGDEKKEVPEIVEETGLSRQYILAWGSVNNFLGRVNRDENNRSIMLAKNTLRAATKST